MDNNHFYSLVQKEKEEKTCRFHIMYSGHKTRSRVKTLDSVSLPHLYSQGSPAGTVGLFLTTIITQQVLTQENITKLKTITRE